MGLGAGDRTDALRGVGFVAHGCDRLRAPRVTPTPNQHRQNGDEGVVVPLRRTGNQIPDSPVAFDPGAEHDRLTGLPALARFKDALRGAGYRRRGGEHPWVAAAGLDGTGAIAERHGPEAVDVLLRAIADRLRESLRGGDQLARTDMLEFGLIVDAPFGDEVTAALDRVAREIRELIAADRRWDGAVLSIGIAPLWSEAPAVALDHAREALQNSRERRPGSVSVSMSGPPPRGG
jgi:GGDEF domain-containing protein